MPVFFVDVHQISTVASFIFRHSRQISGLLDVNKESRMSSSSPFPSQTNGDISGRVSLRMCPEAVLAIFNLVIGMLALSLVTQEGFEPS